MEAGPTDNTPEAAGKAVEKRPATDRFPADKIIAAFDFGTTNSGVAFAHVRRGQRISDVAIRTVRGWPTDHGTDRDESKVPSILRLDAKGEVTSWGYGAADGDRIAVEWFKLALVANIGLPPSLRKSAKLKETRKTINDYGLNVVRVLEQYMRKIWGHALAEMTKTLGPRILRSTPIHVVLTIPAIWGNHAIKAMKAAAEPTILALRGEHRTTYAFISEPEAAAQAYGEELQSKLNFNETFMVVDLGGGTVDIICYKKIAKGGISHLQLEEAAPGDGALCGAMFLDEAFEALLLDKLSAQDKKIKSEDPSAWRALLSEQWQHGIKRSFVWKNKGRNWPVTLSNVPRRQVDLHEDDIRDVFERSVMPGIIALIRQQAAEVAKGHDGKEPRIILPVGGFGRCPYIIQRLREEFGRGNSASKKTGRAGNKRQKVDSPAIEIHSETGESPWTAVVRGACISGMQAQFNKSIVTGRKARTSGGFIQCVPGKQEQGAVWMECFGCHMIPDAMKWVIKKGDALTDCGEKTTVPMLLPCDFDGKGIRTEDSTFFLYPDVRCPERFDPDDAKFEAYGTMKITSTKPIEDLPVEDTDTGKRRVFKYNLQIKLVGGSLEVTATSAHPDDGGKVVGKIVLSELEAK
ncbi:hypothetical protein diail_3288 [Diaporthe ilicicola]|nr:hypothetical protein diail_3288 [Diaporthe ilicicola]